MAGNSPIRHNIQFYLADDPKDMVLDGPATRAAGRPIHKPPMEMVRVSSPANPKSIITAPAHEGHINGRQVQREQAFGYYPDCIIDDPARMFSYAELFPRQYDLFKRNMKDQITGTRLSEVPAISAQKRADLKALQIETVEQLADPPPATMKRLGMEGPALQKLAQAYLAKAQGLATDARVASENAALQARLGDLEAQIAALKAGKPPADDAEAPPAPASTFAEWTDADIKNFIKEHTGQNPRGNPSHETLCRMADDIVSREMSEEAA